MFLSLDCRPLWSAVANALAEAGTRKEISQEETHRSNSLPPKWHRKELLPRMMPAIGLLHLHCFCSLVNFFRISNGWVQPWCPALWEAELVRQGYECSLLTEDLRKSRKMKLTVFFSQYFLLTPEETILREKNVKAFWSNGRHKGIPK